LEEIAMTVTAEDITWARGECSDIRNWVLRGNLSVPNELLPGNYVLQAPPQISTSGGEGRAATWIMWFAALRGYYKVMMRLCAGYNPLIVEGGITSCPSPSEQLGMRQARHVFWSGVLRGRGRKIQRRRWVFSEVQLEILGNEAINQSFYTDVRANLERYIITEQSRYCAEHGVVMGPREQMGLIIARKNAAARDREYGIALAP
jgi:hypothetical protein